MKTNVTLSIDIDVVKKSRRKFSNLSAKVEELLKSEIETSCVAPNWRSFWRGYF